MDSLPTGTVTLVFTDIENSAALSEKYKANFETSRATHFRLLREAAARWQGIEISTAGDAIFLVFEEAADAVQWAIDAQIALHQHDWQDMPVRVRMGMYTGEPYLSLDGTRPDYFGPAVNRAARIMAAGHGGETLASETTQSLTHSHLPPEIAFQDCGMHRLKGVGEEHLWQIVHPALPREFPPLVTLRPERHNLPLPPTPFIGRETEAATFQAMLTGQNAEGGVGLPATTRLLSLVGFGGFGKTRLALHVAENCVESFANGVCWVELEEAHNEDEMLLAIARNLALSVQPQTALREQIVRYLQERELLLIIDNLEQVKDAARTVNALLNAAPKLKILVTSRSALGLRPEYVAEIAALPPADAERFFVQCAQARQVTFTLSAENRADIASLCQRLEGVPLAIELAASRITGMTPHEMLARLHERFRLLQTRAPDLPARQRALRAAIDWSYDLLTEEDRELFAQLGVFAGGFTLEAAEAVCEAFDVFEGVMELRRQSLFRAETDATTQATRFLMLDSLREYACDKLAEFTDSGQGARQRHALFFHAFAQQRLAQWRGPGETVALRQLETEIGNLRAAMEWTQTASQPQLHAELALSLARLLQYGGFHREAAPLLAAGIVSARRLVPAQPPLVAALLIEQAGLALDLSDRDGGDQADRLAHEALELAMQAEDVAEIARAENLLGRASVQRSDFDTARERYAYALTLFARAGDRLHQAFVHNNLGILEYRDPAGDKEKAAHHLQEALRLRRACGDQRGMAETLTNLGNLAFFQSDFAGAGRSYTEALPLDTELNNRFGVARLLNNLGEIAVKQNHLPAACRLFAAAERLFAMIEHPYRQYSADQLAAASGAEYNSTALERLRETARDKSLTALVTWAAATPADFIG